MTKVPPSSIRASAQVSQPLILISFCLHTICIVLICATSFSSMISAQGNFSVQSTSYNCSSNIICLGEAHVYAGNDGRIQTGRLSLVNETVNDSSAKSGLAYYNQPIRLLDRSTRQSASFNSSFTIDNVWRNDSGNYGTGDGITFVISANNSDLGLGGRSLGIFEDLFATPYRSIVVEFDTQFNPEDPVNDISGNHVSLDFSRIHSIVAKNASDASVNLTDNSTFYAWVEYSSGTQKLEVRVSNSGSRPPAALLDYTVDLSNYVQEYMWVGFSSSCGRGYSNFYVGDWTFESHFEPGSGGNKGPTIVGICAGIFIFLVVCATVITVCAQRVDGSGGCSRIWPIMWFKLRKEDSEFLPVKGMPMIFSYKQLSVATKGFSHDSKLGQGGFGEVYRGVLPSSHIPVAVKKISSNSKQGEKEFIAEVSVIGQLRHRNLIQLLGWCKETSKGKYVLVYELMPNGSLDQVLFTPAEKKTASLSWAQRFNIVTGIAVALDYLHQGWTKRVIHRDIKSSNIMLDEEWNAKLGDFGLARLVDHKKEASTTVVAGTRGYLAPEVAAFGKFTDKSDVFAFGAVVLEVACGRKALSFDVPENEMVLADWVWHSLCKGALMATVDPRLEDYDTYWMEVMLTVGLLCSHPDPAFRPSMQLVVEVLAGDVPVPSIPTSKPALAFNALPPSISTDCSQDTKAGSTPKSTSGVFTAGN